MTNIIQITTSTPISKKVEIIGYPSAAALVVASIALAVLSGPLSAIIGLAAGGLFLGTITGLHRYYRIQTNLLADEKKSLQDQINTLLNEKQQLETDFKLKTIQDTTQIASLKGQLNQLSEEKQTHIATLATVQKDDTAQIAHLTTRLDSLTSDRQQLQNKLSQLEEASSTGTKVFDEQQKKLQVRINQLTAAQYNVTREKTTLDGQISNQTAKIENLTAEKQALECKVHELTSQLIAQSTEESQRAALKKNTDALEGQLQTNIAQNETLKAELTKMRTSLNDQQAKSVHDRVGFDGSGLMLDEQAAFAQLRYDFLFSKQAAERKELEAQLLNAKADATANLAKLTATQQPLTTADKALATEPTELTSDADQESQKRVQAAAHAARQEYQVKLFTMAQGYMAVCEKADKELFNREEQIERAQIELQEVKVRLKATEDQLHKIENSEVVAVEEADTLQILDNGPLSERVARTVNTLLLTGVALMFAITPK